MPHAAPSSPVQSRFMFADGDAARFWAFHEENPHVYAELRRFALEAVGKGRRRLSINLLFERLRWFTEIETEGDAFKVNNTFRAWYARLLMRDEPRLAGMFETRKSDADDEL